MKKSAMKENMLNTFFTKYQLHLFFFITYLLSWWSVPFLNGGLVPHGPAVAAVIVIAITSGKQGLREFWQRLKYFGNGWSYVVGPAIIFGYQGIAYLINLLLGATLVASLQSPPIGVWLELMLFGGLWEEIGWSGYALPKLQERFAGGSNGPLLAALILGTFRAIWHLPLFMYGTIYWFDIFIFEVAIQVIIAWLYTRSGGSVLAIMVFHFTSNLMGAATSSVFNGIERTNYFALFMGLAALIAIVISWRSQSKFGVDQHQEIKSLV
jgi:hypothetical protein